MRSLGSFGGDLKCQNSILTCNGLIQSNTEKQSNRCLENSASSL